MTVFLIVAGAARAADVSWEHPGPLGAGQRAGLTLVFDGTEPAAAVELPAIDGLAVLGDPAPASQLTFINGVRRSTLTFTYPVRPEREGRVAIPAFAVETSAGTHTVRPLAFEVGAANLPGPRGDATRLSDVVQARLTPSDLSPYAGEVFDVEFTVTLDGVRRGEVVGTPRWTPAELTAEPWSDGAAVRTQVGSGVRFRTRASAPQPGRTELATAQQDVRIEGGRARRTDPFAALGSLRGFGGADDFFDSFFGRTQMTEATAETNAVQLDVQPLPAPAPADFTGAVGQFGLESTLSPAQPTTGEPITWTLTLTGSGNWPSLRLPARAVPNDLRTLQPKQRPDFAEGELFVGAVSEDLVLIPSQPGDLILAPVRFTYFDPTTGRYETTVAEPPAVHVTGAPLPPAAQSVPAEVAGAAAAAANAAPAAADRLPRPALSGTAGGHAPLPSAQLRRLTAAPFVLLVAYALGLAAWRARLNDPRRSQREAAPRARAAVERVGQAAGTEARSAALLDWQHAAIVVLGLDRAAPTAAQLRARGDAGWLQAWAASEQALYGPEHALPSGWCDAARALAAPRPRARAAVRGTPRRWWPRLATASLLALCLATAADADTVEPDSGARYAALQERVRQAPTDWIARYDLGLAAAEGGDDGRAFAETLAAFAYAPRHTAVRWNATLFGSRVPGVEPRTAALLAGGLAALATPATWQMVWIGGAVGFCLGLGLLLRAGAGLPPITSLGAGVPPAGGRDGRRHSGGPRRRPAFWATALLLAGAGAAASAGIALQRWGALADPHAAVIAASAALHAVPTDAASEAQRPALAAGAVVTAEQEFLGWVKVALAGGERGWLRQDDLVRVHPASIVTKSPARVGADGGQDEGASGRGGDGPQL